MLKTRLLQPQILEALGESGHGARVLIADGNYPLVTKSNPAATRVYLNLTPGLLTVTDVLEVLVDAIPIEAAHVMGPDDGSEPSIYAGFRELLPGIGLERLDRFGVRERHDFSVDLDVVAERRHQVLSSNDQCGRRHPVSLA